MKPVRTQSIQLSYLNRSFDIAKAMTAALRTVGMNAVAVAHRNVQSNAKPHWSLVI